MANISISDLRPAGADLFLDSESYFNDLTEQEMIGVLGQGFYLSFSYKEFDGGLSVGLCVWW